MKKWYIAVASIAAVGGVVIVAMLLGPKPPIPRDIKRQVTSTILVPKSSAYVTDRESVKYTPKLKLLIFNVQVDGVKVVVSEQPTPDSFIDIPQAFDKYIEGMGEYLKFDTAVGSVSLTRPPELKGRQAAVLNSKGTLLYANPDANLTDDQWRRFFSTVDVQR